MSTVVRFIALFVAWLAACLTEIRDWSSAHAGVNVDQPQAPQQWHAEFRVPQPVLLPPLPQGPVPQMVNNSQMIAAQWWQEEENRNALATMEVVRKNARNAALLTVLSQQAAAAVNSAGTPAGTPAGT